MIRFRPARPAAAVAVILFSATLVGAEPASAPRGAQATTVATDSFACHPRSGACRRNQTVTPIQIPQRTTSDFACKPRAGACTRNQGAAAVPANATAWAEPDAASCRPQVSRCGTLTP